MTLSATPRKPPRSVRSCSIPSRTEPLPCSGWGLREDSKRLTSTASEASRKMSLTSVPLLRTLRR